MSAGSRGFVALEEHYLDAELAAIHGIASSPMTAKLEDITGVRLREMDEAGIAVQVLSHAPAGLQRVDSAVAVALAQRVNTRLAALVALAPDRFAAFAALPTPAGGEAAADELERCVRDLGFCGGMVHGPTDGVFLDDPMFWPLLARAEALDVPLYLHPADPLPEVKRAYFGDYARTHPMFLRAAWGYTIETGTHAMRLLLSEAFDRFPRLQIILGHLGETIPFLLARIDESLSRDTPMKAFRQRFCAHVHVTTSGFFSTPALRCCLDELGADRIMFSVDWPYASNRKGADWFADLDLPADTKQALASGNARRLLRLP